MISVSIFFVPPLLKTLQRPPLSPRRNAKVSTMAHKALQHQISSLRLSSFPPLQPHWGAHCPQTCRQLLPASGPLHWLFLGFTYSPFRAYENRSFPAGLPRLLHLNCSQPPQNSPSRLALAPMALPSHKLPFLLVYCLPPPPENNVQWSVVSLLFPTV